jgi:2-polyprenyl-6-methoxyphenol hydroxylase-like FAD-dependent oxidoreductase
MPADIAPMAEDTARMYIGRGQTFAAFPIGRQRIYWGVAKRAPEDGSDPPGVHRMLSGFLAGYPGVTQRIVEATPEAEIIRTPIYDRDPDRTWVRGRVVLLGDAAHMTTPFIGQGAGISMEDAVVLAKELSLSNGLRDQRMLDVALRAYERQRIPRASSIVLTSRRRGQIMFIENPGLIAARNALLRALPAAARRQILEQSLSYQV